MKAEGKSVAERTNGDWEAETCRLSAAEAAASEGELSQTGDLRLRSVVVLVSLSSTESGMKSALRTRTVMERKSLRSGLRAELLSAERGMEAEVSGDADEFFGDMVMTVSELFFDGRSVALQSGTSACTKRSGLVWSRSSPDGEDMVSSSASGW